MKKGTMKKLKIAKDLLKEAYKEEMKDYYNEQEREILKEAIERLVYLTGKD